MARLKAIQSSEATGKTKELLDAVQNKLGMTPNLMKTLANSPAALEGYLKLNESVSTSLNAHLREQIAIAVANANGCQYCLSAHSTIGKMVGLPEDEILAAQSGSSSDAKSKAALIFAQEVIANRGSVSDDAVNAVRQAGFNDGDIADIVANVALSIFTNYFNNVAQTEIDFPKVSLSKAA